ncbi:MAG: hypothetical protein ABL904_21140 [Hyphomicrobiaceae bacterium]
MAEPQPYVAYWSIYTDLRGRRQFKTLYWDRLKAIIGRPAKLSGMEREDYNPGELRCHVYSYLAAETAADCAVHVLKCALKLATPWTVVFEQGEEGPEFLWNRDYNVVAAEHMPLPRLTTVMVTIQPGSGGRYRSIFRKGGRPLAQPYFVQSGPARDYEVLWTELIHTTRADKIEELYWPHLRQRLGEIAIDLIGTARHPDFDGETVLTARQRLPARRETDAVLHCLHSMPRGYLSADFGPDGRIAVLRGSVADRSTNVTSRSFELRLIQLLIDDRRNLA